jgi:hypothetical protein
VYRNKTNNKKYTKKRLKIESIIIFLQYMNILSLFNSFIYQIGKYGPIILLFTSFYLLQNKGNLFFYYLIGFFINMILNLVLKGIFQHPRPSEDIEKFNAMVKHGKRFIFKDNGVPYDIFGMPSGHTQSCIFSTVFVFLSLKRINVLILYLIISLITIYQRVKNNHHTLWQTIVGSIVGFIFAFIMFYLVNQKIKGMIREKPDDFGPI